MRICKLVVFCLSIFLLVPLASFGSSVSALGTASFRACNGPGSDIMYFQTIGTPLPVSRGAVGDCGSASTAADGTAVYGDLTGKADGAAGGPPIYNASFADQHAYLNWADTFTITSGSLPDGTTVDFMLSLRLDDTVFASNPTCGGGGAVGNFGTTPDGPQLIHIEDGLGTHSHLESAILHTTIGVSQNLVGQLHDFSVARAGGCGGNTATADGTALFYVDPITSGASYTTESGHNYRTPSGTPEPATLLLLGTGIASLAFKKRDWR